MNLFELKRSLNLNIKNQFGWKTNRKIITFSIDDYGNVRTASKQARDSMEKEGLKMSSNVFDYYDALENSQDLLMLFDTLSSVKDDNGRHPIFTTFSLSANPNFEQIIKSNYADYFYEPLTTTYAKCREGENMISLLKEGVDKQLILPQFHGRDHVNVKVFKELLNRKSNELLCAIKNRSYSGIINEPFQNMDFVSAFSFEDSKDLLEHEKVVEEGVKMFEEVYGYKPKHFTSPGSYAHKFLESSLHKMRVEFIDNSFIKNEHQGKGKFKKRFNYTGKINEFNQIYFVRNCVYEPLMDKNIDWVEYCLKQIEIAFRWKKVANISSHRVNFSGGIDENNRKEGLNKLKKLIFKIKEKWPEVEFMSTIEVGDLIKKSKNV